MLHLQEGLFTGLLTENLLDANNWNKVSDTKYSNLSNYNNNLVGNISVSRDLFN